MRYFAFAVLLLVISSPVSAVSLFGVDLATGNRDQLRAAVKNARAVLVSEAGSEEFFDVYEGEGILPGAQRLYLGFSKQDQSIAFVEYEFNGLRQPELLVQLTRKYGEPQVDQGKFISDGRQRWEQGGIRIQLVIDWSAYKTRLQYFNPSNINELRAEYRASLQLGSAATATFQDDVF